MVDYKNLVASNLAEVEVNEHSKTDLATKGGYKGWLLQNLMKTPHFCLWNRYIKACHLSFSNLLHFLFLH